MSVFLTHEEGRDFQARMQRLVKPIHLAMYFLKLDNWDAAIIETNVGQVVGAHRHSKRLCYVHEAVAVVPKPSGIVSAQ